MMEAGLEGETENDLDRRAIDILGSWLFHKNVEKELKKTEEDIAVERSSKERILSKTLIYPCCHCSSSFSLKMPTKKTCCKKTCEKVLPVSFMP